MVDSTANFSSCSVKLLEKYNSSNISKAISKFKKAKKKESFQYLDELSENDYLYESNKFDSVSYAI